MSKRIENQNYSSIQTNTHHNSKYQHSSPSVHISRTLQNMRKSNKKYQTHSFDKLLVLNNYSQPKLQNKKMKYYKAANSTFFGHLKFSKNVEKQEISQQNINQNSENMQKYKGFKGKKTHSWNQFAYLAPHRKINNKIEQLEQPKQHTCKILKTQECSYEQSPRYAQKTPLRSTLIQFLRGPNLAKEICKNQEKEKEKQNIRKYSLIKKNNSLIIRQRMKQIGVKSEYKQKLRNYELLFKGYKFD